MLMGGNKFFSHINSSFSLESSLGKPKPLQICIMCNRHIIKKNVFWHFLSEALWFLIWSGILGPALAYPTFKNMYLVLNKMFYSVKKGPFPLSLGFTFCRRSRNISVSHHPVAASLEWFAQPCSWNIWKLAENFSNCTTE